MKTLKILFLIFLILFSKSCFAEIFQNNDLNFFEDEKHEQKNKTQLKEENISVPINEKTYISEVSVKEVHSIKKAEYKNFPQEVSLSCKDLKEALLVLNKDYLLKIRKAFNINDKVNFKQLKNNFYEVPFYFSEDEKCIFNKNNTSDDVLKNKIMSEIKNYINFNGG